MKASIAVTLILSCGIFGCAAQNPSAKPTATLGERTPIATTQPSTPFELQAGYLLPTDDANGF
jgi:hypothetical protein